MIIKINNEASNMGMRVPPKPRPKAPKIFKRKELNYDSRKLLIKNYWDDVQSEYNEANHPTNIYNMFCEMLESMPQKSLKECETIGLFKSALEDTIGKEEAKSKNKVYI